MCMQWTLMTPRTMQPIVPTTSPALQNAIGIARTPVPMFPFRMWIIVSRFLLRTLLVQNSLNNIKQINYFNKSSKLKAINILESRISNHGLLLIDKMDRKWVGRIFEDGSLYAWHFEIMLLKILGKMVIESTADEQTPLMFSRSKRPKLRPGKSSSMTIVNFM